VLLQRFWLTKHAANISRAFKIAVNKNKEQLLQLNAEHLPRPKNKEIPHPFGEVFYSLKQKTLETLNKNNYFAKQMQAESGVYLTKTDLELLESHALTTISTEQKKLEKNLFILSTIVTLAPFLGLLGTVWGILITFTELQAGASASSNSAIIGGLSTALATTVLGLVIAIPALIAYNYLRNAAKTLSSDMEDFLYELLSSLELQYRKVE